MICELPESELPKTYAGLRFVHKELIPCDVTSIVRKEPSVAYKEGDLGYKGRSIRKFGLWLLRTRNDDSKDVLYHLAKIEEILYRPEVIAMIKVREYETHVSVYWFGAKGSTPPELDDHAIAKFVRSLGGTFEVDAYRYE